MEDLQYLTPAMLVGLLRDVDLETFGLALRAVDQEAVDKLMSMVSTGCALILKTGLKAGSRKVNEKSLTLKTKSLDVLKSKIDKGHIVIDPDETIRFN